MKPSFSQPKNISEGQTSNPKIFFLTTLVYTGKNSHKYNQCNYVSSHTGVFQITSRLVDRFMPNKCNDCDYASCRADDLKTHLKMHIGEKSNCSQCKFASSHECNLRKPLRTHSGEKSNKCNQCIAM